MWLDENQELTQDRQMASNRSEKVEKAVEPVEHIDTFPIEVFFFLAFSKEPVLFPDFLAHFALTIYVNIMWRGAL